MTCIVGIAKRGKVYIGGDSASIAGWTLNRTVEPKVFRLGELLIGYCGSFRSAQLIKYCLPLSLPAQAKDTSDMAYMVVEVSEHIRKLLREHGDAKVENNVETQPDADFLIGYRGALYVLEGSGHFQIVRFIDSYAACGGGRDYAYGALAITEALNLPPRDRITQVLQAVEKHYIGACSPFHIEVL